MIFTYGSRHTRAAVEGWWLCMTNNGKTSGLLDTSKPLKAGSETAVFWHYEGLIKGSL